MSDMFSQAHQKWGNTTYVLWVFGVSILLFLIGIVTQIEDTISSLEGLRLLEQTYQITPAKHEITYYALSIAPQVAQIAFFFLFVLDTKKNWWAGLIAAAAFLIDFALDVQFRSSAWLFSPSGIHVDTRVTVAAVLSFIFFTIGSEVFISIGFGMVINLWKPAAAQFDRLMNEDTSVKYRQKAKKAISGANRTSRGGDNRRQRSSAPTQLPGVGREMPIMHRDDE